ncbi:MAG: hypothetical protein HYY76_17660 [Acidobacteria bacterium]|nr:hypothetical protein [Acidobacteriota bacterium]
MNPEWLLYAVRAPVFQDHVRSQTVGATVRGINIRDLKRVELAVPPMDEQIAICGFLNDATPGAVHAVERAKREVELLHEYRTRLTADVVTGKLDVREAAATLLYEAEESEELDDTAAVDMDDAPDDEKFDVAPEEDET